jgi:hypothetical protein
MYMTRIHSSCNTSIISCVPWSLRSSERQRAKFQAKVNLKSEWKYIGNNNKHNREFLRFDYLRLTEEGEKKLFKTWNQIPGVDPETLGNFKNQCVIVMGVHVDQNKVKCSEGDKE